jgi:hypothetical protein
MVGLLGCGPGGAAVGESCATVADCAEGLQCLDHICRPGCFANIDCGDGWVCDDRTCVLAEGEAGDECLGEATCGPGLTCRLPLGVSGGQGHCEPEQPAAAVTGAACRSDGDCRAGACALGRCVELCERDGDCLRTMACTGIPRLTSDGSAVFDSFRGCLPGSATVVFDVPLRAATQQLIAVPVPSTATSVMVVAEAEAATDVIGAVSVTHDGTTIFTSPTSPEAYYASPLRHRPMPGISVLQIPTTSAVPLSPGAYTLTLEVTNPSGTASLDRGRVRIVEKLGKAALLDLRFHLADLAEHPCLTGPPLTAARAPTDVTFQLEYIEEIKRIFAQANISITEISYDDRAGTPAQAGLAVADAGELFAQPQPGRGISIYLMRTLSPAGLELAVGGTPGPPFAGTRASGIAIAASTLCYRDWRYLARITAHGLARYMGLYRNRDPGPDYAVDPLVDSPVDNSNLMYWSSELGTELSNEQRAVLRGSPVLR